MHFPNVTQALREAWRVLKVGGRAAFLVWGSPDEQGIFLHQQILARYVELPAPAPNAPSPFRFARPGTLAAALRKAGFKEVTEVMHHCLLSWPGSPGELWQHTRDIAAPLRALLARLPAELVAQVSEEIQAALQQYSNGQRVNRSALVHVATGAACAREIAALWLTTVTIQLPKPISAAATRLTCKTITQRNPCLSTLRWSLLAGAARSLLDVAVRGAAAKRATGW